MPKTATPKRSYKKKSISVLGQEQPSTQLNNCTVVGMHFDAKAVEAVNLVAKASEANALALLENAKVLRGLADVFRNSNVTIEAGIKIQGYSC